MQYRLSPQADDMGFFYGDLYIGDEAFRLNVLPPLSDRVHWMGKLRSAGIIPDDKLWTIFVDGEEVGRVRARTDIDEVLASYVTTGA